MKKKLFYTFLPLLIALLVDGCSNWHGWNTLNLDLRKNQTQAEVIYNPFYKVIQSGKAVNGYNEVDYEILFDIASETGREHIKYRYFDEATRSDLIDSFRYVYYNEDDGDPIYDFQYDVSVEEYAAFAEKMISKPDGTKFSVYYFGDLSVPVSVYNGFSSAFGKIGIYFQNSFVVILLIAFVSSVVIGFSQFKAPKN